jgi:hypothetical protein
MDHPRFRTLRRLAAVLLSGVLVLAACSSSGEDLTHKTLRETLLQLSDFPPTWRGFPQSEKAPDLLGTIAACTGTADKGEALMTVQSDEFRHGLQRITSTAVALPNQNDVAKRAAALSNPKAKTCAAQALRQRVTDAVPGAKITSAKFTAQEGGIDVPINYTGVVHGYFVADVKGKSTKIYLDSVFLQGHLFYADVTFLGVGAPISSGIQQILIDRVALRAQHSS